MQSALTIAQRGMKAHKEIMIRKRPEARPVEYVLEVYKRDSHYKSIYMGLGFSSLSSSEVEALLYEIGIIFDEKTIFTQSAGRFYGRIKHNGELAELAQFTKRCARL
jgi:hypothetical protein